jgi:hypothetical protein
VGEERSQLQNKAKAMADLRVILAENATTLYDEPSVYTGPSEPVDITLNKRKYRTPKPRGRFRADYGGNSGAHTVSGVVPRGLRRRPKRQVTKRGGFGHI